MDADPAIVTETDRVIIRRWQLDEVDRLFDIYRREEVVRWLGGPPMRDRRRALELIERYLATDRPAFGDWAVVERRSGLPVGSVLLKPLPDGDGEIEIGWHLHPDSWRKGLASEAASALLKHAFANGLEEVWAVTHLDNHRSIGVCRRIGMRLLGITQRWYHEPSLMFWAGSRAGLEPSLSPEEPAPVHLSGSGA